MPRPGEVVAPGAADLRTPALGALAWAGALAGLLLSGRMLLGLVATAVLAALVGVRRWPRAVPTIVAGLVVLLGVLAAAHLRAETTASSPLRAWAEERAVAELTGLVTTDPRPRVGEHGGYVTVRLQVRTVTARGRTQRTRLPVMVVAPETWAENGTRPELGSVIAVEGRLAPVEGELAALVRARGTPRVLAEPGAALAGAAAVRAALRASVGHLAPEERTLVPALVVGDDQGMPPALVEDFEVSGLTHLLAVSGTNLTLIVGFLLTMARWCRVRGRGLLLVGACGVVGFVLLARTEPSVVRAAAMGTVGLLAMTSDGRQRGTRGLGVAVVALLLFDPWLATTIGFALSVGATAGILFLAPGWRDALSVWLPRWLAEAIAVPLAAQIACTPVIAAISGKVSLVAVAANLVAAPAVGPATVAGLAGGLLGVVSGPLARAPGSVAGVGAWWIVTVAERSGDLHAPAVDWAADPIGITLLTGACIGVTLLLGRLLPRRWASLAVAAGLALVTSVPLPTPGWPPAGWAVVACDVGQGDATLLRAGPAEAVVVDVGPDPDAVAGCLRRFGVRRVPALVLTHFHADHVGGLDGVLGRVPVGEIWVSGVDEPAPAAARVRERAAAEGVALGVPPLGQVRRVGAVAWQVVGPRRVVEGRSAGAEGGRANNASIVQVAEVGGVRVLLTGDMEPEAQALLRRDLPGLRVDVLTVPHHGSPHQDESFLAGTGARLALVSVGEDNGYGHPGARTLQLLRSSGARVRRTDLDGDLVVVVDGAGRWRPMTR